MNKRLQGRFMLMKINLRMVLSPIALICIAITMCLSACEVEFDSHVEYSDENGKKEFNLGNAKSKMVPKVLSEDTQYKNKWYRINYPRRWGMAEIERMNTTYFNEIEMGLELTSAENWIYIYHQEEKDLSLKVKVIKLDSNWQSNLNAYVINGLEIDAKSIKKNFIHFYGPGKVSQIQKQITIDGKSAVELTVRFEDGKIWYEMHEIILIKNGVIYGIDYFDSFKISHEHRLQREKIISTFHVEDIE